jgi:hypothetical protein
MMVALKDETLAFYRREATRYRLLTTDADGDEAEQFRRMASECGDWADELDRASSDDDSSGIALNKSRDLAWPLLPEGPR